MAALSLEMKTPKDSKLHSSSNGIVSIVYSHLVALADTDGRLSATISEEEKLDVVEGLRLVFSAAEPSTLPPPTDQRWLMILGHCISLLLDVARCERNRSLRRASMETIERLCVAVHDADCLACFLPGISTTLVGVASGDFKTGSSVVGAAVSCWAQVLALVVSDSVSNAALDEEGTLTSVASGPAALRLLRNQLRASATPSVEAQTVPDITPTAGGDAGGAGPVVARRDASWASRTMRRLRILLWALCDPARTRSVSSGPRARVEIVRLAVTLLSQCRRMLRLCDASPIANMFGSAKANGNASKRGGESSTTGLLVGVVISSAGDNDDSVRAAGKSWLELHIGAKGEIGALLLANVRHHFRSLPRVARSGDEAALRRLSLLCATHIDMLGGNLDVLVDSTPECLLRSLLQTLEFDSPVADGGAGVVVQIGVSRKENQEGEGSRPGNVTGGSGWGTGYFRKPFLYLRESRTLGAVQRLLRALSSRVVTTTVLVDHLVSASRACLLEGLTSRNDGGEDGALGESGLVISRAQLRCCLFLTNELLLGGAAKNESMPYVEGNGAAFPSGSRLNIERGLVPYVLDASLASPVWKLPTVVSDHRNVEMPQGGFGGGERAAVSLSEARGNAEAVSPVFRLVLECVGHASELTGRRFRDCLVRVLYPVLERLGDASPVVRQAAHTTLVRMSRSCGYIASEAHAPHLNWDIEAVRGIIIANIDYLVDAVVARLSYIEQYPRLPAVVDAVARHMELRVAASNVSVGESGEVMPLLTDLVNAVLRSLAVRREDPETVHALLRVLRSVVRAVGATGSELIDHEAQDVNDSVCVGEVVDDKDEAALTRLVKELTIWTAEDDSSDVGDAEIDYDADKAHAESLVAEDTPPKPNARFKVVEQSLLSAQHFVSHESVFIRNAVAEVLSTGVLALAGLGAKRLMLPLIHALWPAVSTRLSREKHEPTTAAWLGVVAEAARVDPEFMAPRFERDVWPAVRSVLLAPRFPLAKADASATAAAESTSPNADGRRRRRGPRAKHLLRTLRCLGTIATCAPAVFEGCAVDVADATWLFIAENGGAGDNNGGEDDDGVGELRSAGIDVWRALIRVDPDAVWLRLAAAKLRGEMMKPPHPTCVPLEEILPSQRFASCDLTGDLPLF